MKVYELNINIAHLNITDRRYLEYKDILTKILTISLLIHNKLYLELITNTLIDNTGYHNLLKSIYDKNKHIDDIDVYLNSVIKDIAISPYEDIYVDLSMYISTFIERFHSNDMLNIYNIHLKNSSFVTLILTQLKVED